LVRRLIAETGLTPWQFAHEHRLLYSSLKRWMRSVDDPPVSTFVKLAGALGVSAGFLIDRKEVK